MKQFLKILAVLGLTGLFVLALAQNTVGGTQISNTATATFTDSNGQSRTSESNTVVTTVQTVYSFEITPDDSTAPTVTTNFTGFADTDGLNDTDGDIGDVITFEYVITNNTNNDPSDPLSIDLDVVQASGANDDYDLSNIEIWIDDNDGNPANGYVADGRDANDVQYIPGTSTFELPAQGDTATIFVEGEIPTGVDGNDVALIDLIATNTDATGATPAQTGPNVSYESNNIAQVEVNEIPLVGVAKNLDSNVNNGDGSYTLTFTFTVQNYGNVDIENLQVVDDLAAVFASATSFTVDDVSSTDFSVNFPGYDGDTDTNLLDGTDTLVIGDSGEVTLEVTVTPGATLTGYNNTATASGESPDGTPVSDDSTDGTDPDDNGDVPGDDGDDDPTNTDSDTPVTFTENPVIGAAKEAGTVVDNGDGTFTVPFTITLENLGDMNLHDVQVTEDLTDFGSYAATVGDVDTAGEYTLDNLTVNDTTTAPALDTSSTFDGDADTALLDLTTSAVLERTETVTITFDVIFYPDFANSPFENQVTATGDLPRNADGTADNDTQDLSDNGTDPDPGDGAGGAANGDPTDADEDDPTPVTVPSDAEIGVAKDAGTVVDNGDGTFTVPFTITLENSGNVDLHDVQVTEDLATEFGTFVTTPDAAGEYTIDIATPLGITGNATNVLSLNTAFDGDTDTNMLDVAAGGYIQPTETVTIEFELTFYPDFASAPFTNQVTAEADEPANDDGTTDGDTSDDSTDGTDPDGTDGDDNPDENDPTPINPTFTSRIGVAKQAAAPTSNGDGTFDVDFTFTVENFGNVDLYDVQVTDDLTGEFGTYVASPAAAGEYTVSAVTVNDSTPGAAITENAGFTGSGSNTGLLSLADNDAGLEVDETITVEFTLTFYPDPANATVAGNTLTFNNQATATGDRPDANNNGDGTTNNNSSSSDTSTNGLDPDSDTTNDTTDGTTDNDNNPNEAISTPITITMAPVIGVAKEAGTVTDNGDGTFTVTYTINVENMGNVDAHDVQITEDLTGEFGTYAATADDAGEFTVSAVTITTNAANALDDNTAFDGDTDTGLLNVGAGGHIRPGETVTLEFDLTFYPDFTTASITGTSATFTNQVTAEADTPTNDDGTTDGDTTDTSDNGTNPDPDNDNNPNEANENDETTITLTIEPVIGVAKDAAVTDANVDGVATTSGPFEITFNFYLENMGNVDLTNISLTDNLSTQFGTLNISPSPFITGEYEIVSITKISGPATVTENTSFDGSTDEDLITTTSSLLVGETAQIQLVINVFDAGTYTNQATAEADGPGGTTTTDDSTDGSDPDGPTNNDDPTDSDDPTPISLDAVQVSKEAQICSAVPCSGANIITAFTDAATEVEPEQFISYSITAENQGGSNVDDTIVIDAIPAPTRFVSVDAPTGPTGTIVQCSTAGATGPWNACPTPSTPYNTAPLVTHVRMVVAGVGGTFATTETASFVFTVYVP